MYKEYNKQDIEYFINTIKKDYILEIDTILKGKKISNIDDLYNYGIDISYIKMIINIAILLCESEIKKINEKSKKEDYFYYIDKINELIDTLKKYNETFPLILDNNHYFTKEELTNISDIRTKLRQELEKKLNEMQKNN